jgi:hypothetical protein
MGGAKAEGLSWSMIQAGHDGCEFLLAHQSQIAVFGEKLADEPVGVFVQRHPFEGPNTTKPDSAPPHSNLGDTFLSKTIGGLPCSIG